MHKKDLIIVGAGGFGKEVAWIAREECFNVLGFLDDAATGSDILGKIADWTKFSAASFLIAVGAPRIRYSIVNKMLQQGNPEFAKLISSKAIIADNSILGNGSIVMPGVIISVGTQIGKHVIINLSATLGHDLTIEDFVSINPQAAISGYVTLSLGVELGTHATLVQNIKVHTGALVTAGSMIHQDVEPNAVMVGFPARKMNELESFS